jgi:eukaryotic-like serine/threonine-protein kinase
VATIANCWDVKKCGRQTGGPKAAALGVCPAATAAASGANRGTNGGRVCWAIAGTLCGGQTQGTFAEKAAGCMHCDFYKTVKADEGARFRLLPA